MKLQRLLGALTAAVAVASCNAVLGIEEGDPRVASSFCTGKAEGTASPEQAKGDCVEQVCDGNGKLKVVTAESDVEDDDNPCTLDHCIGSVAEHKPLTEVPCYAGPSGTAGLGVCKQGIQKCDSDGDPVGDCNGQVLPHLEMCKTPGVDDNCNGLVDEGGDDCKCGDGVISTKMNEQCDDGGTADADKCSSTCQVQEILGVSAGHATTCARVNGGSIKCWGAGGTLGLGDTYTRGALPGQMGSELPLVDLGTDHVVSQIEIGFGASCALLSSGSVKCWGSNSSGQLGLGDHNPRGTGPDQMGNALPAVDLGQGKTATSIAVGPGHTCAVLSDGLVKCWGSSSSGALGLGDELDRGGEPGQMGDKLPTVNLGQGKIAKAVAVGSRHTCALLSDGAVKCWGGNSEGQLGLGDTLTRGTSPEQMGDKLPTVNLGGGTTAKAIAAGDTHTCVLLSDDSVKCWGMNYDGQLGLGDKESRGDDANEMESLPAVNLGTGKTAKVIGAGGGKSCAILSDDSLKCWGLNAYGDLGKGDLQSRGDSANEMGDALFPVDIEGGKKKVAAVAVGFSHICAFLSDGTIKCWGAGDEGQLGLGDNSTRGDTPGEMGDALPTVKLFSGLW